MHAIAEVHKLLTSCPHAIAYMQCLYAKFVKMHTRNWAKYCQNVLMHMHAQNYMRMHYYFHKGACLQLLFTSKL